MNPLEQFRDDDFGICKILYRRSDKLDNVCLFASHTFSPFLPDYIYYYLDEIKKTGLSIVFISSSPICENDMKRLKTIADIVIEKENRGTDFGAWCATLRWLNYGKDFQSLYLCNDSVFGPLTPLKEIHDKFFSEDHDVLGITDSHQGVGYHIQSYFVGLKRNVLKSEAWEKFWAEMGFHKDKLKVIEYYEIGLTSQLVNAGFKCLIWVNWTQQISFQDILKKVSKSDVLRPRWLNRVLYEQKEIIQDINPSSFLWEELIIKCRNPFIKRELFIYPDLYEEFEVENAWEDVLRRHTTYPVWLIKLFRVHYFFFKSVKNSLIDIADISFQLPLTKSLPTAENSFEEITLFKALHAILRPSQDQVSAPLAGGLAQLDSFGIKYFPIQISTDQAERSFIVTFLYFNYEIIQLDNDSLVKLKTVIKRISNPVIVVPDAGIRSIASSLLSLKHDGLLLEMEFFSPSENSAIADFFKNIITSAAKNRLTLFQRPTLSTVVSDALNGENKSAFVSRGPEIGHPVNAESSFSTIQYSSSEDYLQYLSIREKYSILYEKTPLWYKKVGQVIKVFTGNKRIVWIDKGKKDIYGPTTQDIKHWYFIQYEVLPSWYKKLGKLLIKRS
jgi:hypothetical protein